MCGGILFGLAAVLAAAPTVAGHGGFGGAAETRFAFPPWVVWAAGGFLVALSFAIVGAFLTRPHRADSAVRPLPRKIATSAQPTRHMTWPRGLGLMVLLMVIANGFHPGSEAVLPAVVLWLLLWIVLPLTAYTVGDVWPKISPFHALARWAETARGARPVRPWPVWLGAWPATALMLGLVALEVNGSGVGYRATVLGLAALAYTLVTLAGMATFGAGVWLANAEVFTRMMRLFGSVSPWSWHDGLRWRGFTAGATALGTARVSDVGFILVLLLGVNFDGLLFTPAAQALGHVSGLTSASGALTGAGRALVLALMFMLFGGIWWLAARAARRTAESLAPLLRVAAAFAPALLPIAVGYHMAHNLFTVLEATPTLLLAWLDPIGLLDWSTLAVGPPPVTATLPLAGGILAGTQVALVLAGHLVAVVVAHRLAEKAFPGRIMALKAELPITVVMVVYTWIGLWILTSAGGGVA